MIRMGISRQSLAISWFVGLVLLSGCSTPNRSPLAKIVAPQPETLQGSVVAFRGEASDPDGQVKTYRWSFGDGATSDALDPTHTYAQSGEYRVELVVTDDRGATARDAITIRVQKGPKAIATLRSAQSDDAVILQYISGETPLTVVFDSSRSVPEPGTSITGWQWDFGDGEGSSEPNPFHIYTRSGDYKPVLTITDERSQTSQAQLSVQVVSYEAYEGTLELGGIDLHYRLYAKESKAASAGPSMIYQYVVSAPRKLNEQEIKAVLEEIVNKAQQRPRVTRITAYLFSMIRENFMVPRDYDHYLGSAVWDSTEPAGKALTISPSRAYLAGRTKTVLGHKIKEEVLKASDPDCGAVCADGRIAVVELRLQDEPLCRGLLLETLREIARWRWSASYDGFLVNIYSKDSKQPLGWAIGVRAGKLSFQQLPIQKLTNPPSQWDVQDASLWIRFGSVPAC